MIISYFFFVGLILIQEAFSQNTEISTQSSISSTIIATDTSTTLSSTTLTGTPSSSSSVSTSTIIATDTSTTPSLTTLTGTPSSSSYGSTSTTIKTDTPTTMSLPLSSSSTPTTSTTPTTISSSTSRTTTVTTTISSITSIFWVQTVITMALTENLSNVSVTSDLETRLSTAYNVGYSKTITVGRRKRSVTIGDNTLTLVSATRPISSQTSTNLIFFVKSTDFVSPSTVVSNMNQLSLQEMSLIMGRPVTSIATLYNPTLSSPASDDKFWIFGAVFGCLAATAFIIWLVLFVHRRCIIPFDEPLLNDKAILDLESEMDYQLSHNDDSKEEIILKDVQKSEQTMLSSHIDKKSESYIKYDQYDGVTFKKVGNEIEDERIPRDVIIRHVYDNRPFVDDSEYAIPRLSEHRVRTTATMRTSLSRSRHSKSKRHRNKIKTRQEIQENEIEMIHDNQTQQSAPPSSKTRQEIQENEIEMIHDNQTQQLAPPSALNDKTMEYNGNWLEPMSNNHDPSMNNNIIFVKSIDDEPFHDDNHEEIYPVVYKDDYSIDHIYPVYRNTIVIPDSSLNLIHVSESDKVNESRDNETNETSKRKNMRTLNPVPIYKN